MKRYAPIAMAALAATGMWALLAQPAAAQPTLHVVCVLPTLPCTDNGSNTPTSDPFPHFTFSASPGPSTGTDFQVDVLVPTSDTGIPASFALTGTQGGTTNTGSIAATAANIGMWSSGPLDTFLGISASPNNPSGAFLNGPFDVFQAFLGPTRLWDNPNAAMGPLMTFTQALPPGAYVVAFLNVSGWGATANSGALRETATSVPEPAMLALLGVGLAAIGLARRRRHG